MFWYVVSGLAFAFAIALLVLTRVRDRRYEHKKTSAAMSAELWTEIEEERNAAIERREKFKSSLKKAGS